MSSIPLAARLALLAACSWPVWSSAQTAEAVGTPFDPNTSSSVTYQFLPPQADPMAVPPAVAGRPLHKPAKPAAARKTATTSAAAAAPAAKKTVKVERDGANTGLQDNVGKGSHLARQGLQPGAYIGERYRKNVRDYYARTFADGKACPAGVRKTATGCTAGMEHTWQIGQPLPASPVALPVPAPVMAQLPPTPPGHRYVQLAGDILLIATGSKMVVDGIDGLLKM